MHRVWAIIERELRRFRRSPTLLVISLVMPIVQLVVLGYAFGGTVKHLRVGVVDQDHGLPAVKLRELSGAIAANARTFHVEEFADPGVALDALRNGGINGVLTIPPGFSRRVLEKDDPRVALIEDNTDNFVTNTLASSIAGMLDAYNQPADRPGARVRRRPRSTSSRSIRTCRTSSTCCPGSIVLAIFTMVMIGGGIIFIDDKARGLHEGYLVTPITKLELILGFNLSGTIKAVLAGTVLMTGRLGHRRHPRSVRPAAPVRLFLVVVATSVALVSMMFMLMARMSDPLVPRAIFGVLNTLLLFPERRGLSAAGISGLDAGHCGGRSVHVRRPCAQGGAAQEHGIRRDRGRPALSSRMFTLITMTVATLTLPADACRWRELRLRSPAGVLRPRAAKASRMRPRRATGCSRRRSTCSRSMGSKASRSGRSASRRARTSRPSTITSATNWDCTSR